MAALDTATRRANALSRLSKWTGHIVTGPLVATIAALSFKDVCRVGQAALKAHGEQLGDSGPLPKDTIASVAAVGLLTVDELTAGMALQTALQGPLGAAQRTAILAAREQSSCTRTVVSEPVAAVPEVVAQDVAAEPVAAPTWDEPVEPFMPQTTVDAIAEPVQSPISSAIAESVATVAAPSVAAAPTVATVAEPVAQSVAAEPKAKRGKGKALAEVDRGSPEYLRCFNGSTAMQARPNANWRPAAEVFGVRNLAGYVEVIGSDHERVPEIDADYVFNRNIMEEIVSALNEAIPVHTWLWGERGAGKTTLAEQIAARLGRPFFHVTFEKYTEASIVIGDEGLKDGSTAWRDGTILKGLRCDEAPIVLLDEISYVQTDAVSGPLNEIIHPRCTYTIPKTGEVVRFDPRTWFVAADNTNGSGDPTGRYVGTKPVNRATVDRFGLFPQVHPLTKSEEVRMIMARASVDKELATKTHLVMAVLRQKCNAGVLADPPSQREATKFAAIMRQGLRSAASVFETTFIGKYPHEAHEEMRAAFATIWSDAALSADALADDPALVSA